MNARLAQAPLTAMLQCEILATELRRFLLDVPYSSVSQFYDYFDTKTADTRFGVSCVWQAYALGERLAKKGIFNVDYYYDQRHVALVCSSGPHRFLLDPYLLHVNPIQLTGHENTADALESPAYPYRTDKDRVCRPSRFLVQEVGEDGPIQVVYTRYSPTKSRNTVVRAFKFLPSRKAPAEPPESARVRPLLHHGEQNNLSIRLVHRDTHELCELIYPIALHHGAQVRPDHLVAKNNNGEVLSYESEHFDTLLGKMGQSLGCTIDELVNYVLDAVRIYERSAPEHIDYATYNLVDD